MFKLGSKKVGAREDVKLKEKGNVSIFYFALFINDLKLFYSYCILFCF